MTVIDDHTSARLTHQRGSVVGVQYTIVVPVTSFVRQLRDTCLFTRNLSIAIVSVVDHLSVKWPVEHGRT